ncbi:MAG: SRPBCC family protein [Fuscovulum sp.]|jgi:carbon monoxide dehydrogenase subunit G|nr:SRPBCC family protein [Paracoccaceae bacterium]MCZ8082143.1 SRPBCC family protein [Paracoccaceae bacterium]WRH63406.1 MAG: SRPBCC family protein [Fuscovulum sp.]
MKLSGRTDIGAPVAFVFAALSDFEAWERAAMRRGADVHRTDKLRNPGPGMTWQARFAWRGRERQLQVRLTKMVTNLNLALDFDGPSVQGNMNIELVELSAKRTRMLMQVDLKPRTLAARLFIQSMKLTKNRVQRKYDARLQGIAKDIEARFAGQPTL